MSVITVPTWIAMLVLLLCAAWWCFWIIAGIRYVMRDGGRLHTWFLYRAARRAHGMDARSRRSAHEAVRRWKATR